MTPDHRHRHRHTHASVITVILGLDTYQTKYQLRCCVYCITTHLTDGTQAAGSEKELIRHPVTGKHIKCTIEVIVVNPVYCTQYHWLMDITAMLDTSYLF